MKLGIISDSHHYRDAAGNLYNLSILKAQFEKWAELFDEVFICAPLLPGAPPPSHSPYLATNIKLLPIAPAGGNGVRAKLDLAWKLTSWWRQINNLLNRVDAVHVRCPNNISIIGLIRLLWAKQFKQAVYTGSWEGFTGTAQAATYRWQKWWLKNIFRGPVAAYGNYDKKETARIVGSFSPSYSQTDWEAESAAVANKIACLRSGHTRRRPLRLVSVGSLNANKNQALLIRAVNVLNNLNVGCELHILGEGSTRSALEQLIVNLALSDCVFLHGSTCHAEVRRFYRDSDFVVQSPLAEGYGKVPNEAFFHGAIPLLSDVNVSRYVVGETERGRVFPLPDETALAYHIKELSEHPAEMIRLIENGREYARTITLEAWQQHIKRMLEDFWAIKINTNSKRHQAMSNSLTI